MSRVNEAPITASGPNARTDKRPAFLITIDTEADNLWARRKTVTTENARFLDRFQSLCESWQLKPTYLVDYDMARCEAFIDFGREVLRRGTGEIGMHLHPWNTPPEHRLTENDDLHHPYLIEYSPAMIRDKVILMTDLLGEVFGIPITSHRAGRWAFNHVYAQELLAQGYLVDCSVTPCISWRDYQGDPAGSGGVDYRGYPHRPYFVDPDDISRAGDSSLLEVPMTIMPCPFAWINRLRGQCGERSLLRRALNRFFPPYTWFRPKVDNLGPMRSVLSHAIWNQWEHIEFMLHSSEFMPGGSPSFPEKRDIEVLYHNLNVLFEQAAGRCRGLTLSEYRATFTSTTQGINSVQ